MKYKIIDSETFVPGLPQEITDEEAAERHLTQLLKDAVANGSYLAVSAETPAVRFKKKDQGVEPS